MSAKHAVLGLVIERRDHGYQLAQRLRKRCGAWSWEPTGVYSALNSLEDDRYVHSHEQMGSGSRGRAAPRIIYEATPAGVDFFNAWMLAPSAPSPVRQELDLKILFSGPESIAQLIDQTWTQEQQCLDELRALTDATPESTPDRETASLSELSARWHRNAEIKRLQARVESLQDLRLDLKRMRDRSVGMRPERGA